jgi:hypothetical protein
MLATVRNLLIWLSICLCEYFSNRYYASQQDTRARLGWLCLFMRAINFGAWFYVAVVEGTTIANKNFNVGYNCLIPDWMLLSGLYVLTSSATLYLVAMLRQKIEFEMGRASPGEGVFAS